MREESKRNPTLFWKDPLADEGRRRSEVSGERETVFYTVFCTVFYNTFH